MANYTFVGSNQNPNVFDLDFGDLSDPNNYNPIGLPAPGDTVIDDYGGYAIGTLTGLAGFTPRSQ